MMKRKGGGAVVVVKPDIAPGTVTSRGLQSSQTAETFESEDQDLVMEDEGTTSKKTMSKKSVGVVMREVSLGDLSINSSLHETLDDDDDDAVPAATVSGGISGVSGVDGIGRGTRFHNPNVPTVEPDSHPFGF